MKILPFFFGRSIYIPICNMINRIQEIQKNHRTNLTAQYRKLPQKILRRRTEETENVIVNKCNSEGKYTNDAPNKPKY